MPVAAYANDAASSLRVCAIRATRLNSDGSIGNTSTTTANGMYVSDKQTKVVFKPVLDTGDEFVVKNGCGNLALSFKDVDKLKRLDVEIDMQTLDPELTELLTNGQVITAGGSTIGYQAPAVGASPGNGVALEFWTDAYLQGGAPVQPAATVITDAVTNSTTTVTSAAQGQFSFLDKGAAISGSGIPNGTTIATVNSATSITLSAAATASASGVTVTIQRPGLPYWRWVIPRVLFTISDRTAENGPMLTVVTGPASENAAFGNGPLNDWPSGLGGRLYSFMRDTAIPSAQVGYQPIPIQT